jgi:pimeloyl-ACP methyl ester carboxylesterase
MPLTPSSPHIYYETDGPPEDQPLLLIEGLGAQLIGWRQEFVDQLASRGFFVIRADNRDVGLSDKIGGAEGIGPSYTLYDLAEDMCRVLDDLGIASAHVVGQSMGGLVGQALALRYPDRIRSLTLFYTTPFLDLSYRTPSVAPIMAGVPSVDMPRDEAINMLIEGQAICWTEDYPAEQAWLRELCSRSYDRCFRPDGIARQQAALLLPENRSEGLRRLALPIAIIHGRADDVISSDAALALAALMPGSEVHLYPGMGHSIVQPLWPEFIHIIARNAGRA